MKILVTGLVLFIGIHLLPSFAGLRRTLVQRLGEIPYKGLFALPALLGLALIVIGKRQAEIIPVWTPPAWGQPIAFLGMPLVFILLVAAYLPGNIKRYTRHPMLWGVVLWSLCHLLVSGDLASMSIFLSLGVFALLDMASANRRGAALEQTRKPYFYDIIIISLGIVAYIAVLLIHPATSPLLITG